MLVDYHCHLNFTAFKDDADETIKRSLESGVFMVIVGSQIDTSKMAVEMAKKYEKGVYSAVGLHPIHLEKSHHDVEEDSFSTRQEIFDYDKYKELAKNDKVVAIGECGLDYFHIPVELYEKEVIEKQKITFRQHLDLADELDLPVIIHCRGSKEEPDGAYSDVLEILEEYINKGRLKNRGAIHCFVSGWSIAERFLNLGFYLGFTGVITFPKTDLYQEVIRKAPIEKILVETDAPYISPVPHRGKRNEPLYVRAIAEKVAEIRGENKEVVEKQLFENTKRLFKKI